MSDENTRENWRFYKPSGPTIARFHQSDKLVRGIAGPVGSGKTGGCLMEILYRAQRQAPHPVTRVRATKWLVIRSQQIDLEKTTIPSWLGWIPRTVGTFTGGSSSVPARHVLELKMVDGTRVHCVVEFVGLGEHSAGEKLPGWEGTGAYLNEANLLTHDTLMFVKERLGRYPKVEAELGFDGATWRGVWLDFNKPDTEHWLYTTLVQDADEDIAFFDQPAAMLEVNGKWELNPRAENLPNLLGRGEAYYKQQIVGAERWRIRSRVGNQWVASRDGKVVYEEWNDETHVSPTILLPLPGLPIGIGLDAGLNPAAVIGQRLPNGRRHILAELVGDPGTGAQRFGQMLKFLLLEKFRPWVQSRQVRAWADPSAAYGVDRQAGEASWIQTVAAITGVVVEPAPTNSLLPRLESVRRPLSRMIDGQPGFLLSPTCKLLRKGFNGRYRLKRKNNENSEIYTDVPEKNEASHPQDALQYWCAGDGEYYESKAIVPENGIPAVGRVKVNYDPMDLANW